MAKASDIIFFAMAYPLIAVVGLVILLLVGGLSFTYLFTVLTSIWLWIGALLIIMTNPSKKSMPIFAAILGALTFGIGLYFEFQARAWWCNIPILGGLTCGAYDAVAFIPRLIALGINILAAFLAISVLTFVKSEIEG